VWGFHWLKVEVDIHLVYTEKEVGASPSQPITHVQVLIDTCRSSKPK